MCSSLVQRPSLLEGRKIRFDGEASILECMQHMILDSNVLHILDQLQQEEASYVQRQSACKSGCRNQNGRMNRSYRNEGCDNKQVGSNQPSKDPTSKCKI